MSTKIKTRTGAILFILWGVIHILGGGAILAATLESAEAGYAIYQNSAGDFPAIAGNALGYLAYFFLCAGIASAAIGVTLNWRNSELGLGLNTAIAGVTDIGLIIFFAIPGYVSWPEASIGIVLFVSAAIVGGMACNEAPAPANA